MILSEGALKLSSMRKPAFDSDEVQAVGLKKKSEHKKPKRKDSGKKGSDQ